VNYKQEILNRIENFESNQVFIANDFFDIAGYETVRSTLNRLVEDKVIIRIMKGIYYKPKYIELIGEYEAPSVNEVANAIARKYNLITNLGKLLDPLADKILVISALVTLAKFSQISLWFVIVIIFRELMITGLRSIVAAEGVVIAAESLGKWKTATQMIALTLIILIPFSFTINNILLLIPLILTVVSGVEYVIKCKNVLNK